MLEENFVTSMIKSDGNLLALFQPAVAATLGALTLAAWFLPPLDAPPAPTRRRLSGPRSCRATPDSVDCARSGAAARLTLSAALR